MVDSVALVAIGFLIYGPVMLIGVAALDLVPKKAVGTAAGLTGLFGYLGAELGIGNIVQHFGWNVGTAVSIDYLSRSTLDCFALIDLERR
jgi:MFS transporter, OPA family, glycerol-3-phosphate transporter